METGNPMLNSVKCYNGGQRTEHDGIDNTDRSFCNQIRPAGSASRRRSLISTLDKRDDSTVLEGGYFYEFEFELPTKRGDWTMVNIVIWQTVMEGCEWIWDFDECMNYLNMPVDSCNCGGVNGKQGGVVPNICYTWRIGPNTRW